MALPAEIEVVPVTGPARTEVSVPGSKSLTNRALVLAALADGETVLEGALWSEDTEIMTAALRRLGFEVRVEEDPGEACNRTLRVRGLGGRIPEAGTDQQPLEIFVGNAGTAARFLAALVCLGQGAYQLHGVSRMHQRPQRPLLEALAALGYQVDSAAGKFPARIHGRGPRAGKCRISIEESSQFASALLLAGSRAGWEVEITGENREESPYVRMTVELLRAFPQHGGVFKIEPDASSASYFWAADYLLSGRDCSNAGCLSGVRDAPRSDWQIDSAFPKFLPLPARVSRLHDLGDSILTAMMVAPFASQPVTFTDLGRLRLQECERVQAMRTELGKCGIRVEEHGQTLTIFPSAEAVHAAEIETYNDHRVAMCFGILGLKVAGVRIKNPFCVKKTFPNFFQKLAAAPPQGFGAVIRDGRSGQRLGREDLFAA